MIHTGQRDFGETLVDIRDRLQQDLPPLTRLSRVFLAGVCEAFSAIKPAKSVVISTLPDLDAVLLRPVADQASLLSGRQASSMQREQADSLFRNELFRRYRYADQHYFKWRHSAMAGQFVGTVFNSLMITATAYLYFDGRTKFALLMTMTFLMLQLLSGVTLARKAKWFV